MATEDRKAWTEISRDRIRAARLEAELIKFVRGERKMTGAQVTAALGLIRKVLPDLSNVTLQGDEDGGPMQIVIRDLSSGAHDSGSGDRDSGV